MQKSISKEGLINNKNEEKLKSTTNYEEMDKQTLYSMIINF